MSAGAGLLRDAASLAHADGDLASVPVGDASTPELCELRNLVDVGRALVHAALRREESRGVHSRRDFPFTSPRFELRLVVA